jgi:hypothetical protein
MQDVNGLGPIGNKNYTPFSANFYSDFLGTSTHSWHWLKVRWHQAQLNLPQFEARGPSWLFGEIRQIRLATS